MDEDTNENRQSLDESNNQENNNDEGSNHSVSSDESFKRKEISGDNIDNRERKSARTCETLEADVSSNEGQTDPTEPTAGSSQSIEPVIFEYKYGGVIRKRLYRRHSNSSDDEPNSNGDSNGSQNIERASSPSATDAQSYSVRQTLSAINSMFLPSSPSSTSSGSSCASLIEQIRRDKERLESEPTPDVLLKKKPNPKWFITPEIVTRELGFSNKSYGSKLFEERMHGSLHTVQRLELMYKLEHHTGCVNALNFNSSGSLLASCSDDLSVCIWDWPIGKLRSTVFSGHRGNVFQVKFLPLQGHIYIATCARDGQVRLLELHQDGSLIISRRVGNHYRSSNKIALVPDSPHVFLSCGDDSMILNVDIRQSRGTRLLSVLNGGKRVPLYSVSCHPLDSNEFLVGGKSRYLNIYDRRSLKTPVHSLCPRILADRKEPRVYITCAVYNHNGSQFLASYNDEDIYLWDRQDSLSDIVHKYQGHRNNATIKGVSFFGPRSEFVVSGSDCGNIYFWDRETEAIVQWMPGDENGVVNCLEPHPTIPVLATSGLDEDVKIWVPSCEQDPSFTGLMSAVKLNQKDREEERSENRTEDLDSHVLWLLWRHISSENRRNIERDPSIEPEGSPRHEDLLESSPLTGSADEDDEDEDDLRSSITPFPNCSTS